jgi:hypothetical protein
MEEHLPGQPLGQTDPGALTAPRRLVYGRWPVPRRAEIEEEKDEAKAPTAVAPAPAPKASPATAQILSLQRGAGNAAVSRMLARKDDDEGAAPATAPAGGGAATAGLEEAITKRDVAGIVGASGYHKLSKPQKVDAIFILLQDGPADAPTFDAIQSLWFAFEKEEPDMMHLYYGTWKQCVDKGAKLPRWTLWDVFDLLDNTAPEVISSFQAGRVMPAVLKLSDDDYMKFRAKLYHALGGVQRGFICKALAAGRAMTDIEAFAEAIQLKSDEWLKSNLNIVEESDAGGTGISQQWQMSCGPTTVQVLHAQTDPIYAMELSQSGNLNVTGVGATPAGGGSAKSKAEQSTLLGGHGSAATELGTNGKGAWVESDIDALKAQTGLTYKFEKVMADPVKNPAGGVIDKALDDMAGYLDQGMYIPLLIGDKPGATLHYNMLLRYDSTKGFLSHDPGKGNSGWCTRQQFLDNNLKPPLSWAFMAGFDRPSKA